MPVHERFDSEFVFLIANAVFFDFSQFDEEAFQRFFVHSLPGQQLNPVFTGVA